MHLSLEDIATAEACGVTFLPATPAQVERLAMQRKIFYTAGQPILATRGDGFYETAGTLQRLIEEGLQQQRDLAAWQQAETASLQPKAPDEAIRPASPPSPEPDMREAAPAAAGAVDGLAAPPAPEVASERERRRRPTPVASKLQPEVTSQTASSADHASLEPLLRSRPMSSRAGMTGASKNQHLGKHWLVAGAVRRGRASKHWSTRQK